MGYAASVTTFKVVAEDADHRFPFQGYARLVDIPGHERLRGRFVDEYKNTARGAVFVVDSVTLQKDVRDVAE